METILGITMCLLLNLSVVPQIFKISRIQQANDLSLVSSVMTTLGLIAALLYCMATQAGGWLIASYIAGLVLSLVLLTLVVKYQK